MRFSEARALTHDRRTGSPILRTGAVRALSYAPGERAAHRDADRRDTDRRAEQRPGAQGTLEQPAFCQSHWERGISRASRRMVNSARDDD